MSWLGLAMDEELLLQQQDCSRLLAVTGDEDEGEGGVALPGPVAEGTEAAGASLALQPGRVEELQALQQTMYAPPMWLRRLLTRRRLANLQESTALLANFNRLSSSRYAETAQACWRARVCGSADRPPGVCEEHPPRASNHRRPALHIQAHARAAEAHSGDASGGLGGGRRPTLH